MMKTERELAPPPRDMSDAELLIRAFAEDGLSEGERAAFADMAQKLADGERSMLSAKQREWVNAVLDRSEPRAANLVSRGLVPRGQEVKPMWDVNLPKRPPGR